MNSYSSREVRTYDNGATETLVDGVRILIWYNSDDRVYFTDRGEVWRIRDPEGREYTFPVQGRKIL